MIAGIHSTVLLDGESIAARRREQAKLILSEPTSESYIEGLDENLPYIAPHPLIENRNEKSAELIGADRAFGDLASAARINWSADTGAPAPAKIRHRNLILDSSFDDGYELQIAGMQIVAKKTIDFSRMFSVGRVNRAENIDIYPVTTQQFVAANDSSEAAAALLVRSIGLVHGLRPVETDSYENVVLFEKLAPFAVQSSPVRLHGVNYVLTRFAMQLNAPHDTAEELKSHARRLSSLPHDVYIANRLCFEKPADVRIEQLVRPPQSVAQIQHFVGKIETISTVKNTNRARGLREHMEAGRHHATRAPILSTHDRKRILPIGDGWIHRTPSFGCVAAI
jgi:hypothetical protein